MRSLFLFATNSRMNLLIHLWSKKQLFCINPDLLLSLVLSMKTIHYIRIRIHQLFLTFD